MSEPNFRELCAELLYQLSAYDECDDEEEVSVHWNYTNCNELLYRTRIALATPPPKENKKPGFINVCVEGSPPAPYEYWEDWLVDTCKNRTIQGVYIRAAAIKDFSFDNKEAATPPTDEKLDDLWDEVAGYYALYEEAREFGRRAWELGQ